MLPHLTPTTYVSGFVDVLPARSVAVAVSVCAPKSAPYPVTLHESLPETSKFASHEIPLDGGRSATGYVCAAIPANVMFVGGVLSILNGPASIASATLPARSV